ncbi:MAG: ABC transporter permease subunit [Dehalococcoidales bacterium]|nr:ABC transporter permease subunit [Dehalococcoidales bacterium]
MTAFKIMLIIEGIITIGAAVGISIALHLQSWYGDAEALPVLEFITGLIVYFLPLVVLIAFIWAFASFPVIKEKVNGGIECLIATPLGPRSLLMGKGLAVFVPGYVISLISLCVLLLVLNLGVFLPGWGTVVFPWPAIVLGLVINPLLFTGVLGITLFLSIAANPDSAAGPSFFIGFGLMMGMPVGLTTVTFDITSWSFTLWYLLGTVIMFLVTLCLTGKLTRQKIGLSIRAAKRKYKKSMRYFCNSGQVFFIVLLYNGYRKGEKTGV